MSKSRYAAEQIANKEKKLRLRTEAKRERHFQ